MSKRKNVLALASLALTMLILPSCSNKGSNGSQTTSSEVKKTYFTISYSAGDGCTISALEGYDPNKVEQGKEFRFKIATQEGYSVSEVFTDNSGFSLLPDEDGVYSIEHVNSNLTISCNSSINSFRLVFSSGSFAMSPLDGVDCNKIPYGTNFRFTLTANAHNSITKVSYQNADLTPDENGVYTIPSVKASSFVTVTTVEDTYKIVLPSGDGYTIELEDPSIDLTKVAYSKEIKFKVAPAKYHQVDSVKIGENTLEKGTDGYYVIKNQESDVNLAIASSLIQCKVTFDTNGASSSIDPITQNAGTKLAEPTAPSKTLDTYYDSVSFEGWYSKKGKYDFSSLLEGNTDLTAHYTYGAAKKEIVNDFNTSDFTFTSGAAASTDIASSFSFLAAETKTQVISDFDRTLDDGVLVKFGTASGSGFTMPKIDFKTLLAGGNTIYMEAGVFNTNNKVTINGKNLLSNSGDASVQVGTSLRNGLISFKLGSDGKVTAHLKNIISETPFTCASDPSTEIELTDAQANGTEGITCTFNWPGATRLSWFGKPYIVKAERQAVDFSSLSNYSVTNATSKKAEKYAIQGSKDGVMISCSGATAEDKSVLTLDPIKFSEYFSNGEGLRFTLGTSAGQEEIAWVNGESETSLGENAVAPASESTETRDEMIQTWQNWQFDINKAGVFVSNKHEDKTYFVPLSKAQLAGEEGVKILLSAGTESIDKSYIISNISAYKA